MPNGVTNAGAISFSAGETDLRYPGRPVVRGEFDSLAVRRIQDRLNQTLKAGLLPDGDFGEATENAVRLFQARHSGVGGAELEIDGEVGETTWAALFGAETVPTFQVLPARGDARSFVIAMAASQIGVTEQPIGSNRGPRVDDYIRAAGLDPTKGDYPWCVCFLQWVFQKAEASSGTAFDVPKTAGVHALWTMRAAAKSVVTADAANPALIKPAMIFLLDTGGGKGHAGLVESIDGDRLITIEGNTNDGGSREGYGVFRRRSRKVTMGGLLGYLDFCG
ncbi:peptidoglycan-binding protein [Rhizobium panacihumi]|uniref:peptidoglycan-binding protein n=1 Tax=Rhizobium panacihumi TaxID=2008450 RepID=UPI003D7AC1A5